jgi:hypothetical protein
MSDQLNRNILALADEIVNHRNEEKTRQYGPFSEGMERAAQIASGMTGRCWTADDMFIAMIALKFSRQSYNHKEDNLLDAAAYIGAWQNYINKQSTGDLASEAKPEKSRPKRLVPPSMNYSMSIDPQGK